MNMNVTRVYVEWKQESLFGGLWVLPGHLDRWLYVALAAT
jgi:hypothetical protein